MTVAGRLSALLILCLILSVGATAETRELKAPLRLEEGATDVRVRAEISSPGAIPVSVIYRMSLTGRGWMAYDVTIEGVSLVTSYRAGFRRKIREAGVDGLVAELEELTRRRHRAKGGG